MDEKDFHDLKDKVEDIHTWLIGTEHEKENGILYRIRKNEADIKELQAWRNNIKWFASGMILPATYGIWDFLKEIIKHLS